MVIRNINKIQFTTILKFAKTHILQYPTSYKYLNFKNKLLTMGFYSTKTSEEKRVKQLTGDIHLSEEFKEEIKNRDIPIYQGYNIQKRLRFEVEQGQLKGDEVDSRLMELLEENSKNNVSNIYTQEIKKDSDSPNRIPPRPQTNEFKIPPRARDGKTFSTDLTQKEMLEKIIKQNQKIINQNKIIIEELKKVNK